MKSWLPKTSQMKLTSISVLNLCFIGMIVLITGWWIMTLFIYWKSMLGIHPGLMCQRSKGDFVTKTTIKMWHFLNGTLNRKDIDDSWQEIPRIGVEYISSKSSSRYTGIFHFGIVRPFQTIHSVGYNIKPIVMPIYRSIPFWNTSSISLVWSVCCDSLPIVARKMTWLKMGVDDQIRYIVPSSKYFKQNPIWAPSNNLYLFDHF